MTAATDDYSGETQAPTAQGLANAIAHLKRELVAAEVIVAQSKVRVAELEAQLAEQLDAEIAELEQLRPKTEDGQAESSREPQPSSSAPAKSPES
jgi:hypothetical protein